MDIQITNPNKIIYPKEKLTKLDVVKYYAKIAKYMLPYIKNRPISVIRCHEGINGECFFKKHPNLERKFIKTFKLDSENKDSEYFYLTKEDDIIYQAQMGTIEFHVWSSNIKHIQKPDIMTFDLDPDKEISIDELRKGVKDLKNILDNLKLKSFLKTSGGKGYHILVPFKPKASFEKFSEFSKQIAILLEETFPTLYTSNSRKAVRKHKIFIDWQRNSKGATCIAPYSLRARNGATVSAPISWAELDKIKPNEIDIFSIFKRKNKNPWKNFFDTDQEIIR